MSEYLSTGLLKEVSKYLINYSNWPYVLFFAFEILYEHINKTLRWM